jgi:pteridine reductase
VHYRHSDAEAKDVAAAIAAAGGEALALRADLAQVAEIAQLFGEVKQRYGQLDILVNNAANFAPTPLATTTEAQWDNIVDANLKAMFFCSQQAAPLLEKSGRGRIVNFASLGGLLAWPGYIAYCTSKAGVIHLTHCLARALAPKITVNAIAPGTISFPGDNPSITEGYIRQAPLKRTGGADDIVETVLYLIGAPFVSGQVIAVDGGRSIPA